MSAASRENFNFQKIVVILGFSLMAIKFYAYFLTDSVAILTDATESIVNVLAGCIGLYALYTSGRPADKDHPYGHGKVEVISASIEGTMITVAGVLIVFAAVRNMMDPKGISDLDIGIVLVAVAAVANFIVGRIAIKKGRKNRSIALEASGRHLCTDTYSSIGIIAGLSIVYVAMHLGYDVWWMDPLLAMLFGALIVFTGCRVIKAAMDDIMDRADYKVLEEIVDSLNRYRSDDWIDIYNLRVIKYGSVLHVELHVALPFNMTLRDEGEQKHALEQAIKSAFGDSVDLVIVPVPCNLFSCMHCDRDCPERRSDFVAKLNWNVETLIKELQHAPGNLVTIGNEIKK